MERDLAKLGDMPEEEFRRAAHSVADWIASYLQEVGEYPVLAQVEPGEILDQLPDSGPEQGEAMEDILRDFQDIVLPGVTHWNHPSFHAYFAITGSAPGILGEMLASALNVNAMVWRSSPAGTELEERTLAWLRELLGLPSHFDGTINDTASSSTLYALAAAREVKLPQVSDTGLSGAPPGRFYTSDQAHSSVDKAGMTLGFGRRGVTRVASDETFRLCPRALREAVLEDREAGLVPLGVIATLGTTSTTSVDPLPEILEIVREFDLWLHVDAAYGGPAAALPEVTVMLKTSHGMPSFVVSPRK